MQLPQRALHRLPDRQHQASQQVQPPPPAAARRGLLARRAGLLIGALPHGLGLRRAQPRIPATCRRHDAAVWLSTGDWSSDLQHCATRRRQQAELLRQHLGASRPMSTNRRRGAIPVCVRQLLEKQNTDTCGFLARMLLRTSHEAPAG